MNRKSILVFLFFAISLTVYAQTKPYKIVFYNLENFFDTVNDPEVLDDEFTPEGPKKWTQDKYDKKLHNMERVFFDIAAINKDYPVVIGVSEVEKPQCARGHCGCSQTGACQLPYRTSRLA